MENRIITQKDVQKLLEFAEKNMGSYLLFYSKRKKQYYILLVFSILIIVLCILDICLVYLNFARADIAIILTLGTIAFTFFRFKNLYNKYLKLETVIQRKRLKLLERYYLEQNFSRYDLICLLKLLNKKVKRNSDIGITVLLGTLLFPVWENYVSFQYGKGLEHITEMTTNLFLRVIILMIIVGCVWKLSTIIDYILRYRSRKIENIIYLTEHILYDTYKVQK